MTLHPFFPVQYNYIGVCNDIILMILLYKRVCKNLEIMPNSKI